jgi:hypothetical protein
MSETKHAAAGTTTAFHAESILRSGGGQLPFTTAFSIVTEAVTGTQIPFQYISMPGNQPQQNANTVFIWQTSALQIPLGSKPLNSWSVVGNNPVGDNVFSKLSVTDLSYLLGYAVGSDPKNICSLAFLPPTGGGTANPTTFQPSLQMTYTGAGSVAFGYNMPAGARPLSDGDWIGLWQGLDESSLYTIPPNWFVQAPQDFSSGNGALNGVTVLRGTTYTLGYFRGGYDTSKPRQSTLACSTTWMT